MSVETLTTDLDSLSIGEEPSLICSSISDIKKKVHQFYDALKHLKSPLITYINGVNEFRNIVYIEAEVRPECLDKGSDPTERACNGVAQTGFIRDSPAQYIGKKLGGDGGLGNVFPLYSGLDLTKWKTDQNIVYSHVKKGDNFSAKLFYGITYDEAIEFFRPVKLFYKFILYENGRIIRQSIEGTLDNIYPENH